MGNTIRVTRKVASKKHRNGKISEFGVPVFANEVLEKTESKRHRLPANHELESRSMCRPPPVQVQALEIGPDAKSVVASKRALYRIKLVITKQQLGELVSKRISVHDIIEVRKTEEWCSNGALMNTYWQRELESVPEDDEIGCFL